MFDDDYKDIRYPYRTDQFYISEYAFLLDESLRVFPLKENSSYGSKEYNIFDVPKEVFYNMTTEKDNIVDYKQLPKEQWFMSFYSFLMYILTPGDIEFSIGEYDQMGDCYSYVLDYYGSNKDVRLGSECDCELMTVYDLLLEKEEDLSASITHKQLIFLTQFYLRHLLKYRFPDPYDTPSFVTEYACLNPESRTRISYSHLIYGKDDHSNKDMNYEKYLETKSETDLSESQQSYIQRHREDQDKFMEVYDKLMAIDTTNAFPFELEKVYSNKWSLEKNIESLENMRKKYGIEKKFRIIDSDDGWGKDVLYESPN